MSLVGPSMMITPPAGIACITRKPARSPSLNGSMAICSASGGGRKVTRPARRGRPCPDRPRAPVSGTVDRHQRGEVGVGPAERARRAGTSGAADAVDVALCRSAGKPTPSANGNISRLPMVMPGGSKVEDRFLDAVVGLQRQLDEADGGLVGGVLEAREPPAHGHARRRRSRPMRRPGGNTGSRGMAPADGQAQPKPRTEGEQTTKHQTTFEGVPPSYPGSA